MAIRECKECRAEASTKSEQCSSCGAKNPTRSFAGMGATQQGAIIVGVGLVIAAVAGNFVDDTPAQRSTTGSTVGSPAAVQLSVEVDSCDHGSVYTRTEGSVRNDGDIIVHFVRVRLTWDNPYGDIIDTNSTYTVGSESLRPGESSTFSGSTQHDRAVGCFASLLDYRIP